MLGNGVIRILYRDDSNDNAIVVCLGSPFILEL